MLPWLLFVLLVGVVNVVRCQQGPIKHNLPPGVELVDPKSLGFDESQLDLSSLLGNVKLTPINSNVDPKTGLKTQVLTVGFDGEENINLDDFELPQQPGGNNSELVQTAFNSFKDYFKNNKQQAGSQPVAMETKPAPPQQRRRKVVKKPQQPKVVELESEQIEKLLATGKLKSKKIGDSQVIEITQDQLNELYAMENGGEFKSLLGGEAQQIQEVVRQPEIVALPQQPQQPQQQEVVQQVPRQPQVVRQQQPQQQPQIPQQPQTTPPTPPPTPPPTQKPHLPTPPPIIYQFNTNDFEPQQPQNYRLTSPQPQQQQFPRQQYFQSPQQIQKHIKTPTFEFISVPPVSYSTAVQPEKQDPLPPRGKVFFPSQSGARFNRGLTPEQLNTFYEDDGLNYKDNSSSGSDVDKDVERLRGV